MGYRYQGCPGDSFQSFLMGMSMIRNLEVLWGESFEIETNFNAYLESNEEDTNTNQEQDYDEEER